ncbi:MAG: hypothetical protein ACOY3M_00395 [Patescibacteria group bacterium]
MRTKIHNFDPDRKIGLFNIIEQFFFHGYSTEIKPTNGSRITMVVRGTQGTVSTVSIMYTDAGILNSKIFGKCLTWILSKKDEDRTDDSYFYVFVHFDKSTYKYRYFIVPNNVVTQYLYYEHKAWMETKGATKESTVRTFRLGLFYEEYNFNVPMAGSYEDKWNNIRP